MTKTIGYIDPTHADYKVEEIDAQIKALDEQRKQLVERRKFFAPHVTKTSAKKD